MAKGTGPQLRQHLLPSSRGTAVLCLPPAWPRALVTVCPVLTLCPAHTICFPSPKAVKAGSETSVLLKAFNASNGAQCQVYRDIFRPQ
ncbi:hypothetical protein CB1_000228052 [Camelus ferus]|nr:hypothetical protein CB1_001165006 [Camelus ferus]EPY87689.1 hypothetical protein CB1_000228052 [Camelus ferus]